MQAILRATGWLCISIGVVVALYLVYALYWTGLATSRAQDALLETFTLEVGTLEPLSAGVDDPTMSGPVPLPDDVDIGEAVAALEFFRPSDGGPVILDDPVMVVQGVTIEALAAGPGRYPGTAYPGQEGNFAVAGHRTTHGGPFWNLDQIRQGDEIHITDRNGTRWIYEFVETQIVSPNDISVLAEDPLDLDRPMLTLTTCHPRWSQTERMIVFAQLVDEQLPLATRA
ncbi:class E sortase [soil metagenome]